jgi:hypothetical protein
MNPSIIHHGYEHAVEAQEYRLMGEAAAWRATAADKRVPFAVGYAAFKRYRKCWKRIGRDGNARLLYEMICDRPTGDVVRIMRLAGFSDHAGYIREGTWTKISIEEPL